MRALAGFAEGLAVVVFLTMFAGILWPPDAYFAAQIVPAQQGGSNIYDFSEFAALLVFLAIACFAARAQLLRLGGCAWPVLLLCGLAFVSAYWSDDPALVVRRSGTLTLSTLFGVYIAVRWDFSTLVATLVKIYGLAAILSVVVAVALPQYGTHTGEAYTHAWRGLYADKNELGLSCALGIILAVYAYRRHYGPRWFAALTILLSLVLLVGSKSKTPIGVMAAALYAAAIVMALRRRSGPGLVAAFLLTVIGVAGAGLLAVGWQDVLLALGRDATFTNRTRIWQLVLDYIDLRPWLGYGFGAFWRDSNPDAQLLWVALGFRTPHAHNAWLEVVLGLGIVGLGFAVLAWLVVFYRTLRVAASPHAEHAAFGLALVAGAFFENLSEFEFFRPGRMMWLLFVAVLAYLGRELALQRRARGAARRALPARRVSAFAAAQGAGAR